MTTVFYKTSWKALLLNYILRRTAKRWFTKLAAETSEIKLKKAILKLRKLFSKMFSVKLKSNHQIKKIQINPDCSALHIFYPDADKTILYLHGGGYMIGSAESYSEFGVYLSQYCKVNVFLVDYRLVPEHDLTCAIEDAIQSYNYLINSGISAQKIFIMGDSAGGGLALSTTVKLRDMKMRLPKGVICFSPWTDLLLKNSSHQMNKKCDACLVMPKEFILFKNIDLSHPHISPIYADFHSFPDIFIQVSDNEILLDDSIILAEKAKTQGVKVTLEIWKNLPHCFQLFAKYIPEGKQALLHVTKFIEHTSASNNTKN